MPKNHGDKSIKKGRKNEKERGRRKIGKEKENGEQKITLLNACPTVTTGASAAEDFDSEKREQLANS